MEITTAASTADDENTGYAQNEEQNDQQLNTDSPKIEKGSGYGPPGQGSGKTVSADGEQDDVTGNGGSEEERAEALPGTTAGETVTENNSDNAGAGIDYGGTGDDAEAIMDNTEEKPADTAD